MMIINQRVYTRGSLPRVTPHGCMAVVSKGRADSERAQRGLGDAAAASPWRVASALRPGGVPVAMWNRVYQYIYIYILYIYIYVKSPLHVFLCMQYHRQVHLQPQWNSARGRGKRTVRVLAPGGARCQFDIGSGAPPGAQQKPWPMKRRFVALVATVMMLGSNWNDGNYGAKQRWWL